MRGNCVDMTVGLLPGHAGHDVVWLLDTYLLPDVQAKLQIMIFALRVVVSRQQKRLIKFLSSARGMKVPVCYIALCYIAKGPGYPNGFTNIPIFYNIPCMNSETPLWSAWNEVWPSI